MKMATCQVIMMLFVAATQADSVGAVEPEINPGTEPRTVGVVSGAHFQPMKKVTMYTSSVPLTFKTTWPLHLSVSADKLNFNSSCIAPVTKEFCHIQTESLNFAKVTNSLLDAINAAAGEDLLEIRAADRVKLGLTFLGEFASWCCDIATANQLDRLFDNQRNLVDDLEQMNSQKSTDHQALANLSNQITVVNSVVSELFGKVQNKFKNLTSYLQNFKEALESSRSGFIHEISQVHQTLLVSVALMAKQSHSLFRVEILDQCRSNKLPSVLVSPKTLKSKLLRLEQVINFDGYRLAIPSSDVQAYFQLEICSCKIYQEHLYIKVKIPIVQIQADWQLFDFVAIPFRWKNSVCSLHHEPTFLAVSGEDVRIIQGRALQDCRPFQDQLCFVPRVSVDSVAGALCPRAVFLGTTAEKLGEMCAFSCQQSNHVILTQVGPERYFITNAFGKLDLICTIHENKTRLLASNGTPGAIDIAVPCDCRLYLNNKMKIPETYPCNFGTNTKFQLIHVIPAAWSKLKKLHFPALTTSSQTVFPSFEDCLEEDWPATIPHLNVTLDTLTSRHHMVRLEDSRVPSQYLYRNLQSVALVVVIGTLFMIIWRNPFLLGLGAFPQAQALDSATVLTIELSCTVFIIVLTAAFVLCLLCKCYSTRVRKRTPRENVTSTEPGSSSSAEVVRSLQHHGRVQATIRDDHDVITTVYLTLE